MIQWRHGVWKMNNSPKPIFLAALLVLVVGAFSFAAGLTAAPFFSEIGLPGGGAQVTTNFGKVEEIYSILKQDFVDKDTLDARTLSEAAIKGMVASLNDPFTNYLDADHYKMETEFLSGKFEGIGANVGVQDSKIVIISPIPGSPAEKAGIRPGDTVLKVNGQSIEGMSISETVTLIRGPRDTAVKLEILHKGETAPVEIEIVRAQIDVKSVFSEMNGDIAVVKISYFGESTAQELRTEIPKVLANHPRGLVIDLRSNPGGLLDAVVDIASNFLNKGDIILHTVDSEKKKVTTSNREEGQLRDMPLAVLLNEFSASGSEVLSGALQDNKRATFFGTDSFGKGAVNIIRPLSDGSALVVTTARWLTPDGRQIGKDKIHPDFEIKPQADSKEDVQLQAAIDYLKNHTPATSAAKS